MDSTSHTTNAYKDFSRHSQPPAFPQDRVQHQVHWNEHRIRSVSTFSTASTPAPDTIHFWYAFSPSRSSSVRCPGSIQTPSQTCNSPSSASPRHFSLGSPAATNVPSRGRTTTRRHHLLCPLLGSRLLPPSRLLPAAPSLTHSQASKKETRKSLRTLPHLPFRRTRQRLLVRRRTPPLSSLPRRLLAPWLTPLPPRTTSPRTLRQPVTEPPAPPSPTPVQSPPAPP